MASYPSDDPSWVEIVSAALEKVAAEHCAADQQLDDAQRLAAQRHRDADEMLETAIWGVTMEEDDTSEQELNSDQELPDGETSESTKQDRETEKMNEPLTTSQQLADQSQVSQEVSAANLDAAFDRKSASDSDDQPLNKKMKQTLPQAQLQDPLGYASDIIYSLSRNIKNHNKDESYQLLAAMWMDIVELRGVGPEEAKLRQAPAIGDKVVTEERRAAARSITEPLKGVSDMELLSLQLDVEQTWSHLELMCSMWGLDVDPTAPVPDNRNSCTLV